MKIAVIGLGVQGRKRRAVAGRQAAFTVDPVAPGADFKTIQQAPSSSYDAACVCVPDEKKIPILRHLLSRGKHVLVEKPLVASPGEIRALIALARKHHAAAYTAYNHRFEPHIATMKRLLGQKTLGRIHLVSLFYGNGTARDVRNSPWRDKDSGVIRDLGSHLLDMVLFLFGPLRARCEFWSVNRFENKAPDHATFGFKGPPFVEMEVSLLSWRNTFRMDVFGEHGSAHIDGLCKWGPSTLSLRQRVLPSGRPRETRTTLRRKDPTWKREFAHFMKLARHPRSNFENDLWINARLAGWRKLSR